jgi:hypothetical protein
VLVQLDGSAHAWLEGRGPQLTRPACTDDTTGTIRAALFHPVEDARGYFLLLRQLVTMAGCPLALYHDRHGIFQVNPKRAWSGAEQLAGQPEPTQFGRLLCELGVASIAAQSPGERARRTALPEPARSPGRRIAPGGGDSPVDASAVLARYLPAFDASGTAYRPLNPAVPPDALFCFKFRRTVAADNTVQFAQQAFLRNRCGGYYDLGWQVVAVAAPPQLPAVQALAALAGSWGADARTDAPPSPRLLRCEVCLRHHRTTQQNRTDCYRILTMNLARARVTPPRRSSHVIVWLPRYAVCSICVGPPTVVCVS